jgi:methylmalonyl-CoA/ethylmalonyl-CoA epimerase
MSHDRRRIGPIHHVAVVVRSIDTALPRFRELFDLEPDEPPTTFASHGVRLCFLSTGPEPAARVELIEPIDPENGVGRFLASRGEGLHHVCFETDDLPATLAALAAREAELLDAEPRVGAHGPVAFLHPRTLAGVLWELLERHPDRG